MKLASDKFQTMIEFRENQIASLIIESPDVFRELLTDLTAGLNGMESGVILSEDNEPLKVSNSIELLTSYVPFEVNTKKLISGLITVLEQEAINEEHYMRTQELLADIERYVDELAFSLPGNLEYKISLSGLLKMVSPKLCLEDVKGIEAVYEYMKFYREVIGDRIFVFVNLREFYNQKEVEDFAATVLQHKFKILLIDNKEYPSIIGEKRLIIDEDRCEI